MKKKLFAILCATAVTFGLLTGCGGSQPAGCGGSQPAATQAAAPAAAETTAAAAADNSTGNTEGIQASPEFYAKADLASLSGKKIGVTIQSLQNSYWAGVMTALQEVIEKNGGQHRPREAERLRAGPHSTPP